VRGRRAIFERHLPKCWPAPSAASPSRPTWAQHRAERGDLHRRGHAARRYRRRRPFYVEAVVSEIARSIDSYKVIVEKAPCRSTPTSDTARAAPRAWTRKLRCGLEPEFLREGTAITDFLHPDRIVVEPTRPLRRSAAAHLRTLTGRLLCAAGFIAGLCSLQCPQTAGHLGAERGDHQARSNASWPEDSFINAVATWPKP